MARVGISLMRAHELAGGGFDGVLELACLAERMGVDEVHFSDHLALSQTGVAGKPPEWPYDIGFDGYYEPLTALGAVAVATQRIRLSTNVVIAPLRPALFLAKQIATLDVISKGRVDISLGAGWQKEEFDAVNVPFEGRFGHLEEQIGACRALWSSAPASFAGRHVNFSNLHCLPFPPQGAALPICLGVSASPRNFARLVRVADGWFPVVTDVAAFAADVAALKALFVTAGRDPAQLIVRVSLPVRKPGAISLDEEFASAAAIVAAGATIVVGNPQVTCRSKADWAPYIERLLALRQA